MAIYEVVNSRALVPYRYLESSGAMATHENDENELAVNERGAPKEAFFTVGKGDLLYTDGADASKLESLDTSGKEVVYVANQSFLGEHVRLGTFKELEVEEPQAASSDEDSSKEEDSKDEEAKPASRSRSRKSN